MKTENWSIKNSISFDEISNILNKFHIFVCLECKTESKLKLSTFQTKNNWCKTCKTIKKPKYKGENKLLNYLKLQYKTIEQFNKEWCKNIKQLSI